MIRDHLINWREEFQPLPAKKVTVQVKVEPEPVKFDKKIAYAKGTDDFCTKKHNNPDGSIPIENISISIGKTWFDAATISGADLMASTISANSISIRDATGNVVMSVSDDGDPKFTGMITQPMKPAKFKVGDKVQTVGGRNLKVYQVFPDHENGLDYTWYICVENDNFENWIHCTETELRHPLIPKYKVGDPVYIKGQFETCIVDKVYTHGTKVEYVVFSPRNLVNFYRAEDQLIHIPLQMTEARQEDKIYARPPGSSSLLWGMTSGSQMIPVNLTI